MARGFTFKTAGLPEFNQLTATRRAFEKDRTQSIKNVMKDVSSAVIEKRIAKKYPNNPYGVEALQEKIQAYAGIDPARSAQAQKLLQSTFDRNVQQNKISLDREKFGYDVTKGERDFLYTAEQDAKTLALSQEEQDLKVKDFNRKRREGSIVYDQGTGNYVDLLTNKVIPISGNTRAISQTKEKPTEGLDYEQEKKKELVNTEDAEKREANATSANEIKLAKAKQKIAERNYTETQARLTKIEKQYEPIKTELEPKLELVASGRNQLKAIKNSDNPRTLVANITKLIGRMNQDNRLSNLDFTTALGEGSVLEQFNKGFTQIVSGKLDPETLTSMEDLFNFVELDATRAIRAKEWNIIKRDFNSSSYVKELSTVEVAPFNENQLKEYNKTYFKLLNIDPSSKETLDADYYINSGLMPPTQ